MALYTLLQQPQIHVSCFRGNYFDIQQLFSCICFCGTLLASLTYGNMVTFLEDSSALSFLRCCHFNPLWFDVLFHVSALIMVPVPPWK